MRALFRPPTTLFLFFVFLVCRSFLVLATLAKRRNKNTRLRNTLAHSLALDGYATPLPSSVYDNNARQFLPQHFQLIDWFQNPELRTPDDIRGGTAARTNATFLKSCLRHHMNALKIFLKTNFNAFSSSKRKVFD